MNHSIHMWYGGFLTWSHRLRTTAWRGELASSCSRCDEFCADCVCLEADVSIKEDNAAKESGQTQGLSVSAALSDRLSVLTGRLYSPHPLDNTTLISVGPFALTSVLQRQLLWWPLNPLWTPASHIQTKGSSLHTRSTRSPPSLLRVSPDTSQGSVTWQVRGEDTRFSSSSQKSVSNGFFFRRSNMTTAMILFSDCHKKWSYLLRRVRVEM